MPAVGMPLSLFAEPDIKKGVAMPIYKTIKGFTLIEMLVVLAIIAILATISLPTFESKNLRAQTIESVELTKTLKESVALFYTSVKKFPRNNLEAGIPKAEFLIGNYVQKIELVDGAFQITFGNKANAKLKDKVLTIRPMVVKDSPESPISWVCGNSAVPQGMIAVGANNTNIPNYILPMNCF
jgi:type IV pilus assembly protein PilA